MTSLPMAIGLFLLALTTGGLLWARRGGEEMQRIANRYLEPLCIWCLVAVAMATFARLAAGDVGIWLLLPLALATVALGILMTPDAAHPAEVAPGQVPAPPAPVVPRAVPEAPAPPASLWAERGDEDSASRAGLWRRA
jgi:hypothetical protein